MSQPAGDLGFRALRRSDFPHLERWLSTPHVDAWWHQRLDAVAIEAKYGPRVEGREPTHVFVIEEDARPIGFIQWYRWADYPEHAAHLGAEVTAAGIDLAIGVTESIGRGLGPLVICAFLTQIVFPHADITACVTDPESENARSLRAFEKAGFSPIRTVRLPDESCARTVVRCDAKGFRPR